MSDSRVVDYPEEKAPGPQRGTTVLTCTILLLILTGWTVFACVRIEILNARAGYYLPRNFSVDSGRWRDLADVAAESTWRRQQAERYADPTWETRALTASDRSGLNRFLEPYHANSDLHGAVEMIGLVQYPAVLALVIGIPIALQHQRQKCWRSALAVCLVITVACGTLMIYRGYFTSLGDF